MSNRTKICLYSPMLDAENGRTVNDDGRHEAVTLVDVRENREAKGCNDRATDAIASV